MKSTRTIESLEGTKLERTSFQSTLADRCFQLQKTPLNDLSPEDLRLLIFQRIGLSHIVPLAIELLEQDIFTSGDTYVGDLLTSVVSIDQDFWNDNPMLNNRLVEIAHEAEQVKSTLDDVLPSLRQRVYL